MGKPFGRELEQIPATIEWAKTLDVSKLSTIIDKFNHPVYIIGSGGSYSACVYAADLLTSKGVFAKPVTPLELFYAKPTIRNSNLIFISSSGRNTDILFSFKKAIESEPITVINICMRKKTKLASLSSNYSSCTTFEFEPPAGKDGFLATNSLVAYFMILFRAIVKKPLVKNFEPFPESSYLKFMEITGVNTTFTILYGSFHHSVAVDLESKFSEAGLAPSLVSDYRHFAHGRHQWFDKKPDSAVIALTCPTDKKLCDKTLQLLPDSIPKIVFETSLENFEGTIQLLIQAMRLINYYGQKRSIDPGRPGVPDYGSKIYHLRYERLIADHSPNAAESAIIRKAKVNDLSDLTQEEQKIWRKDYFRFINKITSVKYGSLVFDYDGTLCSMTNRFTGMGEEIKSVLLDFVKKKFVLGIISGRGKSLREDLKRTFNNDPELMKYVLVGYYNGSDVAPLTNLKHPFKIGPKNLLHPSLKVIKKRLDILGIKSDENPNQLTFSSKSTHEWRTLKDTLINEIMLLALDEITVVESSHSLDIIPRKKASKNNIIEHCKALCKTLMLPTEILCVGDKGQWPGNDYALLSNDYSLSVGDVSTSRETGWNISPPGLRDEKAVEYLFSKIKTKKGFFIIDGI
jgi:hydroxymethylpyrimidine pyrophosphatase-like HAD family hydrolase